MFLTTHNMGVADELCDRVAFLVNGRIVLIESPRQLKLDHGMQVVKIVYAALWIVIMWSVLLSLVPQSERAPVLISLLFL